MLLELLLVRGDAVFTVDPAAGRQSELGIYELEVGAKLPPWACGCLRLRRQLQSEHTQPF